MPAHKSKLLTTLTATTLTAATLAGPASVAIAQPAEKTTPIVFGWNHPMQADMQAWKLAMDCETNTITITGNKVPAGKYKISDSTTGTRGKYVIRRINITRGNKLSPTIKIPFTQLRPDPNLDPEHRTLRLFRTVSGTAFPIAQADFIVSQPCKNMTIVDNRQQNYAATIKGQIPTIIKAGHSYKLPTFAKLHDPKYADKQARILYKVITTPASRNKKKICKLKTKYNTGTATYRLHATKPGAQCLLGGSVAVDPTGHMVTAGLITPIRSTK